MMMQHLDQIEQAFINERQSVSPSAYPEYSPDHDVVNYLGARSALSRTLKQLRADMEDHYDAPHNIEEFLRGAQRDNKQMKEASLQLAGELTYLEGMQRRSHGVAEAAKYISTTGSTLR